MNNNDKMATHKNQYNGSALAVTLICIVLLLVTQLPTIWSSLTLPFMNHSGIREGQFVGIRNFTLLFRDYLFLKALVNSITYSFVAYVFAAIFGSIFATTLANTTHKISVRFFFTLILLPLVLPVLCITYFLSMSPALDTIGLQMTMILFLKAMPIAFLIIYIAIQNKRSAIFGMVCFWLLALPFWISTNFDFAFLQRSIYNQEEIGELTNLIYQNTFQKLMFGYASAMYFVIILWRILAVSVGLLVLKSLFKEKEIRFKIPALTSKNKFFSGVLLLIGVVAISFVLLFQRTETLTISSFLYFMLLYAIQTGLFCLVTSLLAYPLVFGTGLFRKIYGIVLAVCFVFGNNIVSEYIRVHDLGWLNTPLPLVFSHVIQIPMVVLLAFYANHYQRRKNAHQSYLSVVSRPLIAMSALNFCTRWGEGYGAMINIMRRSLFAPIQMLFVAQGEMSGKELIPLMLLVMIVPVVVFLVFRNFFIIELDADEVVE